MAIVLIQKKNSTSSSAAFASNVTAGNLIVVGLVWTSATISVNTLTDTQGNTYNLIKTQKNPPSNSTTGALYYAKNITGGANTVTVTWTGGTPGQIAFEAVEYSGLDTTSPLDQNNGNTGLSTSMNSGSITTTQADELLVNMAGTQDGYYTQPSASSGWTRQQGFTGGMDSIYEDYIVSSIGTYTATPTSSGTSYYVSIIASFKAASAPAGGWLTRNYWWDAY